MADEKKAAADKADKPAKKPAAKKATAAASSSTAADKKPAAKKAPAKTAADKAPAKKPAAKKATAKSESAAADSASASAAKKAPAAKSSASTTAANKPAAKKADKAEAQETGPKVTTLKMHHLRPADGAHKRKIRVGRGEGGRKGKTAGRGTKGTGARYQVPERFEGGQTPIHMRIPKLPGFKNPFRTEYQVVNVAQIAELFPTGGKVTKADLVGKGAVRKNQLVKVLGDGDIAVKVEIVDADKVSQSAKTKIEAAGGSVNEG